MLRWRNHSGISPFAKDVPSGSPAVYVLRGDLVESVHSIAACVSAVDGSIAYATGNIDAPVYLGSCATPIIAAAVLLAGGQDRLNLSMAEIAVMAGSHDGEPHHVAAIRNMLAKADLSEDALLCSEQAPCDEDSARAVRNAGLGFSRIYNPCSGKHAGLLILSRLLKANMDSYDEREHPAQRIVAAFYDHVFGAQNEVFVPRVDGSGIPLIAVSLRDLATSYARIATLQQIAAR